MTSYPQLSPEERCVVLAELREAFETYKAKNLKLTMARGIPGTEQVALSNPMLDVLNSDSDCHSEDGMDCRSYGGLTGIMEAKQLFSKYMGVQPEEMIVLGSSSLNFMYDCVARAMLTGVLGSRQPWGKDEPVKFLCPVPGYDRHFAICQFLGIEMINIPMDEHGPDMDLVERLAAEDEHIKGIWCVPKYANPMGITYSDEVVRRLARLKPKARDFRIFWDNAYAEHFVYESTHLLNILDECKQAGNPNMVYLFGSTNKITFPGAGVAFFAASRENIAFTEKQLAMQAIGWDKLNMLRHVLFLKDMDGIRKHMARHAEILRPRFDTVLETLHRELTPLDIGSFVKPAGGYFITYIAPRGCAKRIVALCKEAGVVLTSAGATHPYGMDPDDSYVRIAPTYPKIEDLKTAIDIFCVAAKIAYLETL